MSHTGRPRDVMTDTACDLIIGTVRLGIWPERAAAMHGISPTTMRRHKSRHPEFATAIARAEAEAEGACHAKMLRHMDKHPSACEWLMERRWPERWGNKRAEVQVQVNPTTVVAAPVGPPIPPPAEMDRFAKAFAAAAEELARAASPPGASNAAGSTPKATGGK